VERPSEEGAVGLRVRLGQVLTRWRLTIDPMFVVAHRKATRLSALLPPNDALVRRKNGRPRYLHCDTKQTVERAPARQKGTLWVA
jgi:hypothetical protein